MLGINFLFKKMFGTQNEREIKKIEPFIEEVNELEAALLGFSDEELKKKISETKIELKKAKEAAEKEVDKIRNSVITSSSDTEKNKHKKNLREVKNQAFDKKAAEVFAIVREASKRTIGLRHFDVQLMGGIVLHQGKIAEMATGEGKTLGATLPVCLNALSGESVHVVTVNDYLAKRDCEWMKPIYEFLGLSVGVIQNNMLPEEKKKAYACDVVYGTNNEFGFDYLRDNMVTSLEEKVQGDLSYAIVDEVDSILIDEARTPLIISGPVDETNESYNQMRPIVQEIVKAQKKLVNNYLSEFREKIKSGKIDEAGQILYLVHKADPKNREFLDMILRDIEIKTIFDKAQSLFDGKVMEKERDQLIEELYYVFDEKTREATFNTKGQTVMKEDFDIEFMLEDLETSLAAVSDEEIQEEEKAKKEAEIIAAYADQQKKVESIKQLLKAYVLFSIDVDYVIKDNKIIIVDGFTGRMMPGRRFSDGIHEALEAKEQVEVQRESQTLATVTLQNYFRMYDKLSGMTGTAKTEETEFENIYLLPVMQIPTNKPLRRISAPDRIYKTEKEKFNAVIDEIYKCHTKGLPVLVGTVSIDNSEKLGKLLVSRGIPHNILNAKYHEKEAHFISQAGKFGGVTIATNMAGRGTDILLGGNPESLAMDAVEKLMIETPSEKEEVYNRYLSEFKEKTQEEKEKVISAGGLRVIGTERHEARRIDDQLRGRSGRQGDPGSSSFYLSLEDDLMRIFGSDRIKMIMDKLGMEEGEVIENPLVTRAIRTAQKRVESQNFEIRKHLLKYDDVMNQQREVIYRRRNMIFAEKDLKEEFTESFSVAMESLLEGWKLTPDVNKLSKDIIYNFVISIKPDLLERKTVMEIMEHSIEVARENYALREKFLGSDRMHELSKMVMLSVIDLNWKEYLREIDDLREGISWRAYGQKDPFVEFQHEAFRMFTELMIKIDEQIAERIMKISAVEEQYKKSVFHTGREKYEHKEYSAMGTFSVGQDEPQVVQSGGERSEILPKSVSQKNEETYKRDVPKVGRNDLCPCGSGKKYKKCCGK